MDEGLSHFFGTAVGFTDFVERILFGICSWISRVQINTRQLELKCEATSEKRAYFWVCFLNPRFPGWKTSSFSEPV